MRRVDPHAVAYRYGQRLFGFSDVMPQARGLLIGEAPGPSSDPRLPLFPDPENSSANRLRKYAGMSHAQWLGLLRRANMVYSKEWDDAKATLQRSWIESWLRGDGLGLRVLLCGRKVASVWDAGLTTFGHDLERNLAWIPHPSGLNHLYNDPAVRTRAGEFVQWAAGLREEL